MQTSPVEVVNNYIKLRWSGTENAQQLASFFSNDGSLIDAEGVVHMGFDNLVKYYQQPTPTPLNLQAPITLADGRIMVEFTVTKYMMSWTLKAYFEFAQRKSIDDSLLIKKITIERPGFFS